MGVPTPTKQMFWMEKIPPYREKTEETLREDGGKEFFTLLFTRKTARHTGGLQFFLKKWDGAMGRAAGDDEVSPNYPYTTTHLSL